VNDSHFWGGLGGGSTREALLLTVSRGKRSAVCTLCRMRTTLFLSPSPLPRPLSSVVLPAAGAF